MATVTIKKPTAGDLFIPDLGIIIPGLGSDTFTDAETILRIASSNDIRTFVSAGTLVVNDGTNDLSIPLAKSYLALLWSQAGFDENSTKLKTVELDFGSPGTRSKNFTIVDTDVQATSMIEAWQSGAAATGRSSDENEMDQIVFRAVAAAGSFTLYATSVFGSVSGLYKVNYMIR